MSALTPHIRVLRVEAAKLAIEGDRFEEARDQAQPGDRDRFFIAELIVRARSNAKFEAADQLEAEEGALVPPSDGKDQPITYDPKGKR